MQCNRVILRRNFLCPYGVDALCTLGRQRNEGTNCHGWHERKASTVQPLPGNKVPPSQGWQSYLASSSTCHATARPSCIHSQPRRMHSTCGWRSGISSTGALNSSLQHIARSLGNTAPVADTDSLSALKRRVCRHLSGCSASLCMQARHVVRLQLQRLCQGLLTYDCQYVQCLPQ